MKFLPFRFIIIICLYSFIFQNCNNNFEDQLYRNTGVVPDFSFVALSNDNKIYTYNTQILNSPISSKTITGLPTGERIISIDFRPATGQLYGLGISSRLYIINEESGFASALGTSSFSPAISGLKASIDFNPVLDRVRLVSETGQNLRLHPESGVVVATDTNINGNLNPNIGGIAYSNNVVGALDSKLYDIDFIQQKLFIQTPPNDGELQLVGDLGQSFQGIGGFDISPDNNKAIAVCFANSESTLFGIDLMTGKAVKYGKFDKEIIELAIKTNPIAYATNSSNQLFRFNPNAPLLASIDMIGLSNGEIIVGMDFRPANSTLYAVSNFSKLYKVDTASGQLSQVGTTFSSTLSGTSFGVDFDPMSDKLRIISNNGQNIRVNPDTGTIFSVDSNINQGMQHTFNAAAYTNNFIGAVSSVLYMLDAQSNKLYKVDTQNSGNLISVGSLGVSISANNGFDIGGYSNQAYGIFVVNNINSIYKINLTTGGISKLNDIALLPTSFTIGLGF